MNVVIKNEVLNKIIKNRKDLTMSKVAKEIDTSPSAVSRWCLGKTKSIPEDLFIKLCKCLDIDIKVLTNDSEFLSKSNSTKSSKSNPTKSNSNKSKKAKTNYKSNCVKVDKKGKAIDIELSDGTKYQISIENKLNFESYLLILKVIRDEVSDVLDYDNIMSAVSSIFEETPGLDDTACVELNKVPVFELIKELKYLDYLSDKKDMLSLCKMFMYAHTWFKADKEDNTYEYRLELLNFEVDVHCYESCSCDKIVTFFYNYVMSCFPDRMYAENKQALITAISKWALLHKYEYRLEYLTAIESGVKNRVSVLMTADENEAVCDVATQDNCIDMSHSGEDTVVITNEYEDEDEDPALYDEDDFIDNVGLIKNPTLDDEEDEDLEFDEDSDFDEDEGSELYNDEEDPDALINGEDLVFDIGEDFDEDGEDIDLEFDEEEDEDDTDDVGLIKNSALDDEEDEDLDFDDDDFDILPFEGDTLPLNESASNVETDSSNSDECDLDECAYADSMLADRVTNFVNDCFNNKIDGISYKSEDKLLHISYKSKHKPILSQHTHILSLPLEFEECFEIMSDLHQYLIDSKWVELYKSNPEYLMYSFMHDVLEHSNCPTPFVDVLRNPQTINYIMDSYNYSYICELDNISRINMIKVMRDILISNNETMSILLECNVSFPGDEYLYKILSKDVDVENSIVELCEDVLRYVYERFKLPEQWAILTLANNVTEFLYSSYKAYWDNIDTIKYNMEFMLNNMKEEELFHNKKYNYDTSMVESKESFCTEKVSTSNSNSIIDLINEDIKEFSEYDLAKVLKKVKKIKSEHNSK